MFLSVICWKKVQAMLKASISDHMSLNNTLGKVMTMATLNPGDYPRPLNKIERDLIRII
jgi:hypothetical protein